MADSKRLQHYITSGFIQIVVDDSPISAYWAHPQSGGPFPGLILLHDDRGLSAHTRHLVNSFAAVGYYVAAPDLFQGQLPGNMMEAQAVEDHYTPTGVPKVNATVEALRSHHKCNSKMALIGWDFGGTLAYHLAVNQTAVMAVISFYGNPSRYLGHFGEVQTPMLAIFGEKDEIATKFENQLREELIRSGRPHEVIVYPEAQHGFYNDSLPAYNETAAEDAWVQTLAFLETHQGKPPAPAMHTFEPGRVY